MLIRRGPVSVQNLFSRLHWPRGRLLDGRVLNQVLDCQRFDSDKGVGCSVPHPGCWPISDVSIPVVDGGESQYW